MFNVFDSLSSFANSSRPTPTSRSRVIDAHGLSACEPLEERRLFAVNITGSVTLDESAGLQTGGVAVGGEDNNDNDVALSALQSQASTFYNRLFGAGGLGLSTTLPTSIGVGKSGDGFITVTGGGTIVSLGFTKADGTALPVLGGADPGVASGLSAVTGGAITLFADAVLGNRMVIGVDTASDKVLAMFLDPNSTLTSAKVWTIEFEPLSNPITTNPDDPLTLGGLGVGAGKSIVFDFNSLHSGSNLFGTVGDATNALIVIAENPVIGADGGLVSSPNGVIKTSQGGGPTTIGVNSQMFDPGEGAYFTYAKTPNTNFLGANLSQTEANDADNILYTGGTITAGGASTTISQTQGNGPATMKITAFDISGSPQARNFVNELGTGTTPTITSVKVNGVAVSFTTDGNGVIVGGLNSGDTIAWTTSAPHDRVLIEGVGGKFDIGAFAVDQAATESTPLSGIRFEDSGPTIGSIANSILDFLTGQTVTKTLNGAVGTDAKTGPYTIDQFTTSLTINGVEVRGVASGNSQVVTYFANTNGNGTFGDAGDTPYFRLTLNQSGAGSYTFDVLFTPPPAVLQFDFNSLHSGSNLFGMVGDAANALIVIAENPVIGADGGLVSSPNGVLKTSQGGGPTTIGVNSQMFDAGEGAYFTYAKSPNTNFLGAGLSQTEANDADNILYTGGTLTATAASTTISQTQGNGPATMKITAFDISGSPQQRTFVSGLGSGTTPTITSVKVNGVAVSFTTDGNGVIVGGLKSGDTIEWTTSAPHDRVLIEGVAGKFDIGGFAITQANPTPDQRLDFVAKITDGDGDTNTAGFSVGIDGTGSFDDGIVSGVSVSALTTTRTSVFSSMQVADEDELEALVTTGVKRKR
jgi:hypothetical protein